MKKNEIYTITAPNGAEVTGVVVNLLSSSIEERHCDYYEYRTWLCYAQNRLFSYNEAYGSKWPDEPEETLWVRFGKILVDYAILPEYDTILEEYQRNTAMENASTLQPWEEEFEREIQGCNDK